MTKRFKDSVDALVYAFFHDLLAKGNCSACAVGSMVAWGAGERNRKDLDPVCIYDLVTNDMWAEAFSTTNGIQARDLKKEKEWHIKYCIQATGYNADQLAKVEYAFETNTTIQYVDYGFHSKEEIMQDQFNGLCAVLDVLCEIEKIPDSGSYKKQLTK
ncbi:hypothetical protein [Dyadobacter sediminis]|uniref:Uncharacterized protein n=1 Tax=Dyadobacter sediminis TaxID=1493691 RepID=A0A5R9KIK4_9BACT|nr:hypothetical protein [Dyadobacter sediminis]TLU96035.1 hypothetical protein FEM55_02490 [Dyadobacter sediminis]GGB78708.1 hypothetical protein GCM10011325_02800 [Dyadobacter sediminis]